MGKLGRYCIITRTSPGAEATAQKVAAQDYEPIVLPAAILNPTNAEINIDGVQALLVTSSNAPRLAKLNDDIRKLPVFAVGDATARACGAAGFTNVISAGGDASALAVLVADRLKPQNGALTHLRGNEVAGDVAGLLRACKFEVRAVEIYQTIENPDFAARINDVLRDGDGVVLFHSPKGAQRFAKYVDFRNVQKWAALCISSGASLPIDEPAWAKLLIAPKPNEVEMLNLL